MIVTLGQPAYAQPDYGQPLYSQPMFDDGGGGGGISFGPPITYVEFIGLLGIL